MPTIKIPISSKVLQNVDETALNNHSATIENGYVTEVGSLSRFPQLVEFADLGGAAKVFMTEWEGDMVAVTGGRVFSVMPSGDFQDKTRASVTGTGRPTFARTEYELLMAAGGPIIKYAGARSEVFSPQAPETTHVGFLPSGYVTAIEPRSGRFQYSAVGDYDVWNPLDVLSASGSADNITASLVSEFGELFLAGPRSIEQFDETASGTSPLSRRWFLGAGLYAPYTFLSFDNRIWGLNNEKEFVAFSSQLGQIESGDVQAQLEAIDDWSEAWACELPLKGQRFVVLQAPNATNRYDTKGITFLYDYQKRRWSQLFGWDDQLGVPVRWPGWSYFQIWDRKFVGGEGKIYELTGATMEAFRQRFLWRSGHISLPGQPDIRVNELNVRVKRGNAPVGQSVDPLLSIRVNKENMGWSRWVRRSLGRAGQRDMKIRFPAMGIANSWQFEIACTDDGDIEIAEASIEANVLK